MDRSLSRQVTNLSSLEVDRYFLSDDIMVLVCLVILEGRMIRGSCQSMDKSPPNVIHHPTKFCAFRHCGSGDVMILVCHVILEDHVIKVLKSAITIFSKVHGMSYSHIRNFTIKVALAKTFACVSIDSTLILVVPSCITNDGIYAKKAFAGPSKNGDRKQKDRKKSNSKAICLTSKRKNFI